MKARVMIFGYVFLLGSSLLHSMEITPLLSKKTPQEELNNYFKETLPRLKLFEIGEHYRNLPMECRGKVIQRMSHELLILHRVALYLPDKIQQQIFNNVKSVMFDGDSKAVNIFYQEQPMLEAFQLYQTIKKSIREGDSVACLYKMPHYRRNEILEKINPWYSSYSSPIITFQEQEKINKLNTKARQYFSGKKMWLVADSDLVEDPCRTSGVFVAQGVCVNLILNGVVLSVCGCAGGWKLMFSPITLAISSGIASTCTSLFCMLGICCGVGGFLCNTKKVTL